MKTLIHEEKFRGEDLIKKIAKQPIILCGAGAVGSNIAENLVRQGFQNITAIDIDRVEDHNRHTQTWDRRDVGQMKVAALKNRLFNIMGITIEATAKKLDRTNVHKLLKPGSIVIDGFDNSESRGIVTAYCSGADIECLHIGLSQDCAEVTWNQVYRVSQPVKGMDVCEYPLARNTVLMAITVGTESLIRFIESGVRESYIISLGDFKVVPK